MYGSLFMWLSLLGAEGKGGLYHMVSDWVIIFGLMVVVPYYSFQSSLYLRLLQSNQVLRDVDHDPAFFRDIPASHPVVCNHLTGPPLNVFTLRELRIRDRHREKMVTQYSAEMPRRNDISTGEYLRREKRSNHFPLPQLIGAFGNMPTDPFLCHVAMSTQTAEAIETCSYTPRGHNKADHACFGGAEDVREGLETISSSDLDA